jgi:hypothetical protein
MNEKFVIMAGVIPLYQDKILILQRSLNHQSLNAHMR